MEYLIGAAVTLGVIAVVGVIVYFKIVFSMYIH